ncbi:MAG: TetR/AcrR family transcriptional regulator [Segniliparus sp.]|uniref:TetR/AcrR family transcriptional regulator n=1 Tax=Segniliparus sp. TaxID=2804064 RepID=UPI003F2D558A
MATSGERESNKGERRRFPAAVRTELILEAATSVFAKRGSRANMVEIATACGIRRSVLYYYFPTRKDLYLAVVDMQLTKLTRAMAPVLGADGDPEARFRHGISLFVRFAEEHPEAWDVLFAEGAQSIDSELDELHRFAWDSMLAAVIAPIGQEIDQLGLDIYSPRVARLAEVLLGGVTRLILWWRDHPETARGEIEDSLVDLLWFGARGFYAGDRFQAD